MNADKHPQALNTLATNDFDQITLIASQICGTPIAVISTVEGSQQRIMAQKGLAASTINQEEMPSIEFYSEVPITNSDGVTVAKLAVMDSQPRHLNADQMKALKALGNQLQNLLEARSKLSELEKINEKLEFNRIAMQNISDGVIIQDAHARIIDFNPAALDVLGLSEDQIIGKGPTDPEWHAIRENGEPFLPQDRPAMGALRTGLKQNKVTIGLYTSTAELRWLNVNSTPLFLGPSSKPTHCVTVFNDITDLKRKQSIIEKNESDLQRILNTVPAMIGHWSRDLLNLNANKAYMEYFGKTPEEIKGKHIKSVLGPEVFAKNYPYMKAVLEGKVQTFERELLLPNGHTRHTLAVYLPDVNGEVIEGFFVIVSDISEIKKLETQRREMEAKLITSSRMSLLGEMAGGIAHEINNPLTIIKGKVSQLKRHVLQNGQIDSEAFNGLGIIENTVDRISKIIKGLRAFSRNAEDDPMLDTKVSLILDDTLTLCQERFKNNNVSLQILTDEDFSFPCRPTQMSQVLMNLLDNSLYALQALPEKWVQISTKVSETQFTISVVDSGEGLPEKIIDKLMQPFFTTKEVGVGTGLGLSISKGIIESHGGTLKYDRSSTNTRFVIELPRLN